MGKHKSEPVPVTWSELTEPIRRGRKRIKPKFVPELVAWLLVNSYQYERIVASFRSLATRPNDEILQGNGEYARHALSVIQTLINNLGDGFNRPDWEQAKEEVSKHLNWDGNKITDPHSDLENNPIDTNSGI